MTGDEILVFMTQLLKFLQIYLYSRKTIQYYSGPCNVCADASKRDGVSVPIPVELVW